MAENQEQSVENVDQQADALLGLLDINTSAPDDAETASSEAEASEGVAEDAAADAEEVLEGENEETSEDGESEDDADGSSQTFLVDGQQVKLDHLLDGYRAAQSAAADYQGFIKEKQRYEQNAQDLVQRAQQFQQDAALLQELQKQLHIPSNAELREIYKGNDAGYIKASHQAQENREKLANLQAAVQRSQQIQQQQQEQYRQQYIEQASAWLMERKPEWKDPKIQQRDMKMIASRAQELGYSDQEMNMVGDPRLYLALLQSAQYVQQQKVAKGKKVAPKQPSSIGSKRTAPPQDAPKYKEGSQEWADAVIRKSLDFS